MKKQNRTLETIKLVGIKARTNNANEMAPEKAIISKTIAQYFSEQIPEKITQIIDPAHLYCVYTDYESDEQGDYTYFVGTAVSSFEAQQADLAQLVIPASHYTCFECGPGAMPELCIKSWQKIWQMDEKGLDGKRSYIADFEIYDARAQDPMQTIFDLYIGVK